MLREVAVVGRWTSGIDPRRVTASEVRKVLRHRVERGASVEHERGRGNVPVVRSSRIGRLVAARPSTLTLE